MMDPPRPSGTTDDLPSESVQRVQAALERLGLECRITELPSAARTARAAAEVLGCSVAQIAKSIVFRGRDSGAPLLVVASGANRIDEGRLSGWAGEPVERADPEFVRERTGFAIGGVSPVGHAEPPRTWIDVDLLRHEIVWAAAGTPHTVFGIDPRELPRATGGEVVSVQ